MNALQGVVVKSAVSADAVVTVVMQKAS